MRRILQTIADEHGTPCFVYFFDQVVDRCERVRATFGSRFEISYAVKANPNHHLLRAMLGHVDMLDVSSIGEVRHALASGWPAERLSFTGPAKRDAELLESVRSGVGEIIVESLDEARRLDAIAGSEGTTQNVLIRLSPARIPKGFGLNLAGKPTQFGIDESDIDEVMPKLRALDRLNITGLHIYSGTQCLNAESIAENYGIFAELFTRVCTAHEIEARKLVFGSGIGIPYHAGSEPVDLQRVADIASPVLDKLRNEPCFSATRLILESGRYLVGEAGVFLTRVIGVKESRGGRIGICDGGMNNHLAATGHFGAVIHRNYPMFKVSDDAPGAAEVTYELVGPLCTTIDTLGHGVLLNELSAGDVIAVGASGAYGLTASPVYFISHELPREILVETVDGRPTITDATQIVAQADAPVTTEAGS